jgi:ribosomal protein S6--L-glutamate ligase
MEKKVLGIAVTKIDSRGPLILEVNSYTGLERSEGTTSVNVATEIIKFVFESVVKKTSKREKQ